MVKSFCAALLILSALLLGIRPAHAILLEFVPAVQVVSSGATSPVDIFIDGLGDGMPPSVGGFSFDVTFNPAVVTVTNAIPGPFLGDTAAGEALFSQSIVTGLVSLAELSFLTPAELDARQPGRFRLATLFFTTAADAVAGDVSLLEFTGALLVLDAFGQELGPISVQTATLVVSEPGGLIVLGLTMLIAFRLGRPITNATWKRASTSSDWLTSGNSPMLTSGTR